MTVDTRAEIVEDHLGFVWHCARRLPGNRELDVEDLVMCGVIGLLEAIDHFDPERGASFLTFAAYRIRGAMVDAIRAARWFPESRYRRSLEVRRCGDEMAQRLGRYASLPELAQELGVPLERIESWRRHDHTSDFERLDEEGAGDLPDARAVDPGAVVDNDHLLELIEELDHKAQTVIRLYYFEELNMVEIGRRMGLTSSRVSQIRTKALARLRFRLELVAA